MKKRFSFDLEGIFDLGDDNFSYSPSRKELVISILHEDIAKFLNKKYGGVLKDRVGYYDLIFSRKNALQFIEDNCIN